MSTKRSEGLRALICEDDAPIRRMMETMLRRDGFTVVAVGDGAAATEHLGTADFDLIVLDLMMPGVNGFEVLAFLQENKPRRLKRVLITTAIPSAMASGIPPSICHVLPKPFDMVDFVRHARECAEDTLTRKTKRSLSPAPSPA
ncbi:MAG: response regulator [Thermoanaerobaculia bacterium]